MEGMGAGLEQMLTMNGNGGRVPHCLRACSTRLFACSVLVYPCSGARSLRPTGSPGHSFP